MSVGKPGQSRPGRADRNDPVPRPLTVAARVTQISYYVSRWVVDLFTG